MRGMERIGLVTSLVWSFISGGVWNNRARVAGQRVIRQGWGAWRGLDRLPVLCGHSLVVEMER